MTLPLLSDFTTVLALLQDLADLGYRRAPSDVRVPENPDLVRRPDMRPLVPCWASEEEEALAETGSLMLRIYPFTGLSYVDGQAHLSVTHDADGKLDHRSWEICNGVQPPEIPVCPEEVTLRYLGQYVRRLLFVPDHIE
jgi:hypothetical protein